MQTLHEQELPKTVLRPEVQTLPPEQTATIERRTLPKSKNKRLVSKGAYVQAQTDRAFMGIVGVGLWAAMALVALLIVGCSIILCLLLAEKSFFVAGGCLLAIIGLALLARMCGRMGLEAMREVNTIDPGVPFTRANTADLPAPDTLVRASAEPVETQATVLLRAAATGPEKHEEQLLRVAGAQEQP